MKKIILIFILLLAFFLRFYSLGDFPALNADEAAIGYNAYSLIQTGADEHGNPWPIHFQSFNDYKPGLYFYIVLPFVKFFGLNAWTVRTPGAFLGVLTVLITYLIVRELKIDIGQPRKKKISPEVFPLTASFFLAISPWHIHFSRGGWEVNVATFFIATGVWLFLKAVSNPKYYVHSSLLFVASLYTYHAARIVVPLLILGLLIIYWREVKQNTRIVIVAALVGFVLLFPLGMDLMKGEVLSRAAGVGLFADPGPIARINEQRGEHEDFRGLEAVLLHNKPINYSLAFLENWGEHFWGEFLFLSGDKIQRNRVPETGQMYLLDILFVIAGFVAIAKAPFDKLRVNWKPILLWLIVAPAAAALTFQSPHALRSHNMIIPLVIISAYGLVYLSLWLHSVVQNKKALDAIFLLFVVLIAWNFTRYLHMYWVHMAKEYPFSSQYGVEELIEYIVQNGDKYEKIIVTDRYDQPYILFLYYLNYPPEKFQDSHQLTARDKFGFSTVRSFSKFRFEPIDYDVTRVVYQNSLIIGTDEEIPDEANIVENIYGQNGYLYFQVVAN
ncbi:glycosyltransferase family 39 protein [Patescibacteria group bacterium]|nr:glycosyltransferase family 39 protein [Patescibacteria group bacterium]